MGLSGQRIHWIISYHPIHRLDCIVLSDGPYQIGWIISYRQLDHIVSAGLNSIVSSAGFFLLSSGLYSIVSWIVLYRLEWIVSYWLD